MITRMTKLTEKIWDSINLHHSEWRDEELYKRATEMYNAKSIFKRKRLKYKIFACTAIVVNDFSQDFDTYLPILSYLILCVNYRIKTAGKLVEHIRKANLPFEYEAFKMFVEEIFQVNCECINAYQSEV